MIHQVEPYVTEKEIEAVSAYLRSGGWLTEFNKTKEFEQMLAGFAGTKHAVVVTSGTAALYLALLSCGVGPGDRVLVPAYTMVATINAILWAGAEPVLVDIDHETMCADLKSVSADLKVKAFLYVSINGRCGAMDDVVDFCKRRKIVLIEDACQAYGSAWQGKKLGTWGELGVISFTPHKIITTGQGGAVLTDNDELARKIRGLKDFDRQAPGSDWHKGVGFNFKFTDVQAVIGIEQMKLIDYRVTQRRKIYQRYQKELIGLNKVEFLPFDFSEQVPWFVDILLPSRETRDDVQKFLRERQVIARPFYPPLNHQPPFQRFPRGSFPVAEDIAYRGLWLPSSIGLKDEQILTVCQLLKDYFKES